MENNPNNGRIAIPAPRPDDPVRSTLQALDAALCASKATIPPMRNRSGELVNIRFRSTESVCVLMRSLGDGEEPPPSPAMPFIRPCEDRRDTRALLSKHLEFLDGDRSVRLPAKFVTAYSSYKDSRLPIVESIATAPVVLPDGAILSKNGYYPKHRLLLLIPDGVRNCVPSGIPTAQNVAKAYDFLTNTWLCDVNTDSAGKDVLIALTSTIINRAVLSEIPTFIITSRQGGWGGKTTAAAMAITAAIGSPGAVSCWPGTAKGREWMRIAEREGSPVELFDSTPAGSCIACPPSSTVAVFTGNKIRPANPDISLVAYIEHDKNQRIKRTNPIDWTQQNRLQILRALYTVMLENPRSRRPVAA